MVLLVSVCARLSCTDAAMLELGLVLGVFRIAGFTSWRDVREGFAAS
jgi:hypothetical protein